MARILVVDDERFIRNTIKDILEHEKYIVDVAEDATQAFEKAKTKQYDLILTDIVMPGISGIVLLEKLKEDGFESPIIIMPSHGNIEIAVECIKKGAFDFLEKPLDLNRLLVSTRNALDKNKLIKETKTLKKKIQRNYEMIDNSHYCVVYYDAPNAPTTRKSGTKIALDYALKHKKEVIILPL
mgnify:CR=1 FL=1